MSCDRSPDCCWQLLCLLRSIPVRVTTEIITVLVEDIICSAQSNAVITAFTVSAWLTYLIVVTLVRQSLCIMLQIPVNKITRSGENTLRASTEFEVACVYPAPLHERTLPMAMSPYSDSQFRSMSHESVIIRVFMILG